ncbi:MAG: hypothetical protein LBJ02_07560 [Bifidobacteriaceae bacterium]|nr:hypothetical protein [Bifidobacteriaceae bacterium]
MTIRNIPAGARDELAARAARSGRSMQEYVLGLLVSEASRPPQAEVLAELRARARTMPPLEEGSVGADLAADRR